MLKILSFLMISGLILPTFASSRELTAQEAELRAEGLRAMTLNHGVDLKVTGEYSSISGLIFMTYYFDYIQPRLNAEANLRFKRNVLIKLTTSHLHLTIQEGEAWRAELATVEGQLQAFARDPMWLIQLDEWAALRHDISGSLPDVATSMAVSGDFDSSVKQFRAIAEGKVLDAKTLSLVPASPYSIRTRIATGQVEGSCDGDLIGN